MSAQENEKRKGCSRPVIMFFIFAVAIVIAFLIVGLVKTCNAEHEEDRIEQQIEEENSLGMSVPVASFQLFA